MSGPLVIFGNPPTSLRSEREAWGAVQKIAASLPSSAGARHLVEIAHQMLTQLYGGVHVNPAKVKGDTVMSHHVQAIAYVHAKDGGRYVHGFGNCDPDEKELAHGILNLNALKEHTHVDMIAHRDGTISLVGTKGQPLAALFEE